MDAIAVEAATLARRDCGAMAPRGVRVAEPLALRAVLREIPLAVREGGHVARVDRHVTAELGELCAQRREHAGDAGVERVAVGAELDSEAVAGVDGRDAA